MPSLLVEFRKRLSEDVLNEINEMIIEYNTQKNNLPDDDDRVIIRKKQMQLKTPAHGFLMRPVRCSRSSIRLFGKSLGRSKKDADTKIADCSHHHCNAHRPPCGDAFCAAKV